MASACRVFCQNYGPSLSKIISTKLRPSTTRFIRHHSHGEGEQLDNSVTKHGAFAEFYEKTKDNKQLEEDEDFEVLLKNSNFINVNKHIQTGPDFGVGRLQKKLFFSFNMVFSLLQHLVSPCTNTFLNFFYFPLYFYKYLFCVTYFCNHYFHYYQNLFTI